MRIALFVVVLLLFPVVAYTQNPEPQIRILAHGQFFDGTSRVGIATWTILPDITEKNFGQDNPIHLLVVLGPAFRSKDGQSWLEVMGGTLLEINRHSKVAALHPLLNTRAYLKWGKANDLYLENQTRQDRLLFAAFSTAPLTIGRVGIRLGAEGEAVVPLDNKVSKSFSLGPRASIKLPYSCSLATVLFINQDRKLVWRTYIKFGR